MTELAEASLLIQFAATWGMVGVIWFVQIVHYPLFAAVGASQFAAYEKKHQTLTTFVVAPLMLIEASSATLLLWLTPVGVSLTTAIVGLAMLLGIWASTFFWQVPAHEQLSNEFDIKIHAWLVRSNWARTLLWTARGVLVGAMILGATALC